MLVADSIRCIKPEDWGRIANTSIWKKRLATCMEDGVIIHQFVLRIRKNQINNTSVFYD